MWRCVGYVTQHAKIFFIASTKTPRAARARARGRASRWPSGGCRSGSSGRTSGGGASVASPRRTCAWGGRLGGRVALGVWLV